MAGGRSLREEAQAERQTKALEEGARALTVIGKALTRLADEAHLSGLPERNRGR